MASDFKLSDCLTYHPAQPCWDCAKACGGCSWTELDEETHKPRFQPVPGWDAIPTRRTFTDGKARGKRVVLSYAIRFCPEFVKEERHGTTGD